MEVIYNSGLLNLSESQFELMKENDFADLNNYYRSIEKNTICIIELYCTVSFGNGNNLIDYGDGADRNLLNLYTPKIMDYNN
ncbi:hypothetical protein [Spiroplasma endosymbiont of Labia minor]|uniref:hypothetical protein n=1 Tax=Spiroplasma endosymbiont of Labia minor TaxID=3066305 RepID=UPI0030D370D7